MTNFSDAYDPLDSGGRYLDAVYAARRAVTATNKVLKAAVKQTR